MAGQATTLSTTIPFFKRDLDSPVARAGAFQGLGAGVGSRASSSPVPDPRCGPRWGATRRAHFPLRGAAHRGPHRQGDDGGGEGDAPTVTR